MPRPPRSARAAALPRETPPRGRDELRLRAAYSEAAGIYRVLPGAVATPSTTAELQRLVREAASAGLRIVPRGAGSGMTGSNLGGDLLLDLTSLDGAPLKVEPATRRARTGAAVTLSALQEAAGRHRLRLPPDPSSARFATLGGILSTNASGPRSVRSGPARRWVEAIELVAADGALLSLRRGARPPRHPLVDRFERQVEPALRAAAPLIRERFPRTRKNTAGYALDAWLDSGDLLDLVVGAEGTLGIVTTIEWRLEPVPAFRGGIRAVLSCPEALGEVLPRLLELAPSALEYLDRSFVEFAAVELARLSDGAALQGGAGVVMVELEGEDGTELESRLEAAEHILRGASTALRRGEGPRGLEALWAIRHAASPILARLDDGRRSLQVIEDGCVPLGALPAYIAAVRAAAARQGMAAILFGHAGDGHLHVNLLPDVTARGFEKRLATIYAEVTDAVLALGGTPSGEHGDGRLRTGLLDRLYGAEITALFRAVKEAFDPDGTFNPGVKVPPQAAPGGPLAALKVGPRAAKIPADIATGLREIERHARYSLWRVELADAPRAS